MMRVTVQCHYNSLTLLLSIPLLLLIYSNQIYDQFRAAVTDDECAFIKHAHETNEGIIYLLSFLFISLTRDDMIV
jgi:hypothetical protein